MKKKLNQKLLNLIEYYHLINNNILFNNSKINRITKQYEHNSTGTKKQKLEKLKLDIKHIKNCELKKNFFFREFG